MALFSQLSNHQQIQKIEKAFNEFANNTNHYLPNSPDLLRYQNKFNALLHCMETTEDIFSQEKAAKAILTNNLATIAKFLPEYLTLSTNLTTAPETFKEYGVEFLKPFGDLIQKLNYVISYGDKENSRMMKAMLPGIKALNKVFAEPTVKNLKASIAILHDQQIPDFKKTHPLIKISLVIRALAFTLYAIICANIPKLKNPSKKLQNHAQLYFNKLDKAAHAQQFWSDKLNVLATDLHKLKASPQQIVVLDREIAKLVRPESIMLRNVSRA